MYLKAVDVHARYLLAATLCEKESARVTRHHFVISHARSPARVNDGRSLANVDKRTPVRYVIPISQITYLPLASGDPVIAEVAQREDNQEDDQELGTRLSRPAGKAKKGDSVRLGGASAVSTWCRP
jgi:hypothetical protein